MENASMYLSAVVTNSFVKADFFSVLILLFQSFYREHLHEKYDMSFHASVSYKFYLPPFFSSVTGNQASVIIHHCLVNNKFKLIIVCTKISREPWDKTLKCWYLQKNSMVHKYHALIPGNTDLIRRRERSLSSPQIVLREWLSLAPMQISNMLSNKHNLIQQQPFWSGFSILVTSGKHVDCLAYLRQTWLFI